MHFILGALLHRALDYKSSLCSIGNFTYVLRAETDVSEFTSFLHDTRSYFLKGGILDSYKFIFYMNINPSRGPLICRSNEVSTPIGGKVKGVQIFGGHRPQNFKIVSA